MEENSVYAMVEFDYYAKGHQFYQDPARDVIVNSYICPDWPDLRVIGSAPPGYEYDLGAMCTYAGVGGAIVDDKTKTLQSAFGPIPRQRRIHDEARGT